MISEILKEHPLLMGIPELAKWKLLILDYGIDCNENLLESYPELARKKVKYKNKIPTVQGGRFYDSSKDVSVIPSEVIFQVRNKQTLSKLSYNETSPFRLTAKENKLLLLDKETEDIIPITIMPVEKREYSNKKIPINRKAPEGEKLESYVQIVGLDRIALLAYDGCQHWLNGCPCKFCDSNPKRLSEGCVIPSLNSLVEFDGDPSKWWKNVKEPYLDGVSYSYEQLISTEVLSPHKHFQLMAGNIYDKDLEWKICLEIASVLNSIHPLIDLDSYLNITPPTERGRTHFLNEAKNIGFKQIAFNLEVYGKKAFGRVCPGKAKSFGYESMVQALETSVEIFGAGNVRTNFVLGAQPINDLINGVEELADKGIVSDYSVFIPKKHTIWQNKQPPSIDEVIRYTVKLAEIYKSHNFKGIYCGLSSRSNIIHEVLGY